MKEFNTNGLRVIEADGKKMYIGEYLDEGTITSAAEVYGSGELTANYLCYWFMAANKGELKSLVVKDLPITVRDFTANEKEELEMALVKFRRAEKEAEADMINSYYHKLIKSKDGF